MTKELKVFKSEEFGSVRVVEINNEPWFVAKDISDFLNYSDASAISCWVKSNLLLKAFKLFFI